MRLKGKAFCPRCGKTDKKLFNGLCRSCFIEDFSLITVPDKINLTTCTQCGSVQKKGRWYDSNLFLEDQAAETILEHIEVSELASDVNIVLELGTVRGSILEFLIKVTGHVLGGEVSQEFLVKVKVDKTVCSECSKYASGYYEAVIQLRADDRSLSAEEIEAADEDLRTRLGKLSQENRMAYISQRAQIKEGVDYYIGSYKAARKLTESLKNKLGGMINESPRLMGRDKSAGKDLYRVWILLRLPHFLKGDFVKYNDLPNQVTGYDGSKIYLKDLESSERISIPWKSAGKLEVVARKDEIRSVLVSSKTPESVQILHPETYQPVDIALHQDSPPITIGEEVEVVEIGNVFYLLD